MKTQFAAVLALIATALTSVAQPALASENVRDIQLSKNQKAALISHFQKQIARHEKMSLEEIRADMIGAIEANRKAIANQAPEKIAAFDVAVKQSVEAIHAADDKDMLILSEKANMQELMTSTNYMFYCTRSFMTEIKESFPTAPFSSSLYLVVGVPFALAGDGVAFIFQLAFTLDDLYNGV